MPLVEDLLTVLVPSLIYGTIISLLAAGMSLIYGIMNTVNTAHGAFYMLGGFLGFLGATLLNLTASLSFIFAVAGSFLLGAAALVVLVPKRMWVTLDPDDQNTAMLLLLAFAMIAEEVIFLIFGGGSALVPGLLSGTAVSSGPISISQQQAFSVAVSLLTYVALYIFLYRMKLGKAIRAFSQDRETAAAMGVNVDVIAVITFGLGTVMAALCGTMLATFYSITPSSGWDALVIGFIVVTLGGIGSISGSLLAGLIYGVAFGVMSFYSPRFAIMIVLLAVYVVLLIKPTGLLGEIIERA